MKRQNTEYVLQTQVVRFLELQYPDVLFNGSPGGVRYGTGKEAIIRGAMAKRAGATKGWPDLMIYQPLIGRNAHRLYCGIVLEFKSATGRVSPEQTEVLKRLEAMGWKTAVCRTFEEAEAVIKGYLG